MLSIVLWLIYICNSKMSITRRGMKNHLFSIEKKKCKYPSRQIANNQFENVNLVFLVEPAQKQISFTDYCLFVEEAKIKKQFLSIIFCEREKKANASHGRNPRTVQ